MTKLITVLIVSLLLEAVGVVFLSKGLKQLPSLDPFSFTQLGRVIAAGFVNSNILLGVFFEALFFGGLLTLMSNGDVSFVWPLTSLGFVLTTLAAKIFLHEQISRLRWTGVCLIMAGAALITWSEKMKERQQVAPSRNLNEVAPSP